MFSSRNVAMILPTFESISSIASPYLPKAAVLEFLRAKEGHVRHVVRKVEEERLSTVRSDEGDPFVGVSPRDRRLLRGPLDDGPVSQQRHIEVFDFGVHVSAESLVGRKAVPGLIHVVRIRDAE